MTTQHQPDPEPRFPARTSLVFQPLALLLVLTGCLSRPALVHQNFAFQSPLAAGAVATKGDHVLALRTVEVSPLFQGRSLAYRTGPDSYELDPYASFLTPPDRALTIPVCAYLRNSGAFKNVVEPGSPLAVDTFLDVQVGDLYGDFRQADKPAAVLSLRLLWYRGGVGKQTELLLQKDYSRSISLQQKTAAAVVAGWDKALAEIMAEAASDLATALHASASIQTHEVRSDAITRTAISPVDNVITQLNTVEANLAPRMPGITDQSD